MSQQGFSRTKSGRKITKPNLKCPPECDQNPEKKEEVFKNNEKETSVIDKEKDQTEMDNSLKQSIKSKRSSHVSISPSVSAAARKEKLENEFRAKTELAKLEAEEKLRKEELILLEQKLRDAATDEKYAIDEEDDDDEASQKIENDFEDRNRGELNQNRVNFNLENDNVRYSRQNHPLRGDTVNHQNDRSHLMQRQPINLELPFFSGNIREWPAFISEYRDSTINYQLTEKDNIQRLRKSLKGAAKDTVEGLLLSNSDPAVVINLLELRFGQDGDIIEHFIEELQFLPVVRECKEDIINFTLKVKNLASTIINLDKKEHLHNPILLKILVKKLPNSCQREWGRHARLSGGGNLEVFAAWMMEEAKDACYMPSSVNIAKQQQPQSEKPFKPRPFNQKKVVLTTNMESKQEFPATDKCSFCDGEHKLIECRKFEATSVDNKWQHVKMKKVCFCCLKKNHRIGQCSKRKQCGVEGCVKIHHPLLHNKFKTEYVESTASSSNEKEKSEDHLVSHTSFSKKENSRVLLKVLPVTLIGPRGSKRIYALLDEASTVTLLKEEVADELGLDGPTEDLNLRWTDPQNKQKLKSRRVQLRVRGENCQQTFFLNNVRTMKYMDLPTQSVNVKNYFGESEKIMDLNLATFDNAKPSLLIGQDHWKLIVSRELIEGKMNSPGLSNTKLGWVVHGKTTLTNSKKEFTLHISQEESQLEMLHKMIKETFSTETFGVKSTTSIVNSKEEERAAAIMNTTAIKRGNRWEVGLPWKYDRPQLPNSKQTALYHLYAMEKKMDKNENFAIQYCHKIEEYLQKGYARALTKEEEEDKSKRIFYLPHFGVINPNKPKKIRLVFNAAAKSSGTSLNDLLLKGPDLMTSLVGTLFNFRQRAIAFCGDVKEMFHQVLIRPEDQHAQRFLWRGMERNSQPQILIMQAMIFGAVSSPYIAQEVKNRNASFYKNEYPEAVKAIIQRHYVDDYLDSVDTEEEAIQQINEVMLVQSKGGFELRNWVTNSQKVFEAIDPELRASDKEFLNTLEPELNTERVLGLKWDPVDDTLSFTTNFNRVKQEVFECKRSPTKREVLRLLMSLYDPLGLLVNYTIQGRMLVQDIWRSQIGWDDHLPETLNKKWIKWLSSMNKIKELKIPRSYCKQMKNALDIQLHLFSDASEKAFAAAAYIRMNYGDVEVRLISAKARVTPLKGLTIPRAELQGAVLASRLAKSIKEEHNLKFNSTTFWCDSQTVIKWIRSEEKKHQIFISHRIGEILEQSEVSQWRWIPTKENVADEATRDDKSPNLEKDSRWLNGPSFLKLDEEFWPKETLKIENQILEEEEEEVLMISQPEKSVIEMDNFSSYEKLLRVTAWIKRIFHNAKYVNKIHKFRGPLKVKELDEAERVLIRKSQEESFAKEYSAFLNGKPQLKSSPLYTLSPYMDENRIIRMRGRTLKSEDISEFVKKPIILEPRHRFTQLLMESYHRNANHLGQETILNNLRQRFWIIRARSSLKKVANNCIDCRFRKAKPEPPEMGDLPPCRLKSRVRPFTITGVDYFGPLEVTIGRSRVKRYGVLFTCLTIRAIHLELAMDLSTDSTLNVLRRFIARRGEPQQMWSDNGTNLRGADEELKRSLSEMNQEEIQNFTSLKRIQWNFIPPAAPHMGGSWERLIQSVKKALKTTLKDQCPKEDTLRTLLIEAENSVNSRPITRVSEDPEDREALTPNHFLKGTTTEELPMGVFSDYDCFTRKQWRIVQYMADQFWTRWIREYLPSLNQRKKWHQTTCQLKPGDLVLMLEDNCPRNHWPKGIVIACHPGEDGNVRVVDIKTAKGEYRRPVTKICRIDSLTMGFWPTCEMSKTGREDVTTVNLNSSINSKLPGVSREKEPEKKRAEKEEKSQCAFKI